MPKYHVIHTHTKETCFGPPDENPEMMQLWKQVRGNAKENNVTIESWVVNPTEHIFFIVLEGADYSDIEKTIGDCKKTGEFQITPVIEPPFF
ncbi:MAG: hypothetical protein CL776_06260 [Chloroflexi bacterium]|nr:hypothetical protein [Chloroflexota bacterium]|tara:strand:+ start:3405 stop:3680 length:276 start_codon:yes stop_codon:yes gene_type:complete